jgi:hypothetical protein
MIMEGQQGFWKRYELYTDNSSHVMAVKQILQPCYDSQTNTADMLWQSNKYCSHVVAVKEILQPCYDSQTNTAAMLLQSNKYRFVKCCRNIHARYSLQGLFCLVAYRQPSTALWYHTREWSSLFLKKTQINEGLLTQVCNSLPLVN